MWRLTSQATSSTIGWVPVCIIGPSLDIEGVERVIEVAIADVQPLNGLVLVVVLTNAAQGNSETVIELAVLNSHVCTVCLDRDTVIAVVDSPVVEADVAGPDSVGAVRVCFIIHQSVILRPARMEWALRLTTVYDIARIVHEDIGKIDIV